MHCQVTPFNLSEVSDHQLVVRLEKLLHADRRITARLLAHLGEADARKLYLEHACSSMHVYCVRRLHMSDGQAYKRIQAARAARRFPHILEMVAANELHLSAVVLLAPHLTGKNSSELLSAAVHRSKREVEELIAGRFPQPDAPAMVRRLPATRPTFEAEQNAMFGVGDAGERQPTGCTSSAAVEVRDAADGTEPASPPTGPAPERRSGAGAPLEKGGPKTPSSRRAATAVIPTAAERYKVQFTADAALHAKLREAQALLGHTISRRDLAGLFDRALSCLLREVKKKRFAQTNRPRPEKDEGSSQRKESGGQSRRETPTGEPPKRSRRIPNAVRRAVYERDGGRCTFVDGAGHRCAEHARIEFHHLIPYARGGPNTVENLTLRCSGHNRYAAEQELGREFVDAKIREARAQSEATQQQAEPPSPKATSRQPEPPQPEPPPEPTPPPWEPVSWRPTSTQWGTWPRGRRAEAEEWVRITR